MNVTEEFINCLTSTISTLKLLECFGFVCVLLLFYVAGLTVVTYLYCKRLNKRIEEDIAQLQKEIKELKENKGDKNV